MLKLLENFTFSQILFFVILLALAIKEAVTLVEWTVDKLRKAFKKESKEEQEQQSLHKRLDKTDKKIDTLFEGQNKINKNLETMQKGLNLVIDSDKDDIKAWITEKHHIFMEKRWIDYQSLDTIEKRYEHYLEENGNSFVGDLMEDLRVLPKHPPME